MENIGIRLAGFLCDHLALPLFTVEYGTVLAAGVSGQFPEEKELAERLERFGNTARAELLSAFPKQGAFAENQEYELKAVETLPKYLEARLLREEPPDLMLGLPPDASGILTCK